MADTSIEAAVRTLRVFEAFAVRKTPLSITQLAEHLRLPMSSTLGLVRTLLQRGYLFETRRRGGYYPTNRMLRYALEIGRHDPVVERVKPTLARLREDSRETVVLGKIQADHAIYLAVFDSPEVVRVSVEPGTLRPLHATATGKALLAALDPATRRAILERTGMPRLTDRTILSLQGLESALQKGVARGWHDNAGEAVPDLRAVSRAVALHGDVYAVSIMGPLERMERKLKAHVRGLAAACAEIADGAPQDALGDTTASRRTSRGRVATADAR